MITSIPIKAPWALGLSKHLKKKPEKVTVEGKNYVMFRSKKKVALLDSVCPHRGADLCDGKIVKDCIQCPYHGWEFDDFGKLTHVPSIPKNAVPQNGDVNAVDVVENGGFIWMIPPGWKGELPTERCPEMHDPNWTRIYGSSVLEGNLIDWILNGTDISHINYVHDFANEEDGRVSDVSVVTTDEYVDCFAKVQPKASSALTEHMQPEENSSIHSRFMIPNTTSIRIHLKDPYEFITFTSLLPIDDNHTKMTWCLLYPKHTLMDLPLVSNRFHGEMHRTISQDEQVIKNITPLPIPYKINVHCDKFQTEALKSLGINRP